LAAFSLAPYTTSMLVRPSPNKVTLDSPAIEVMTDLSLVAAVTIESYASLVSANEYMIARGVRSLFVATPEGRVTGLITAADVLGERPVRVSHARGVRRNELVVADVMTPIDAVAAMRMEDVRAAKVGHIVASLTQAGRHHGLVAEVRSPAEVSIRGIFSASQIARQLGVALQIPEVARTFAEVEQVLHESR
jgi:signal-transduction protein with cAMP-binding, CBS, and nucleotidyltransferase domain